MFRQKHCGKTFVRPRLRVPYRGRGGRRDVRQDILLTQRSEGENVFAYIPAGGANHERATSQAPTPVLWQVPARTSRLEESSRLQAGKARLREDLGAPNPGGLAPQLRYASDYVGRSKNRSFWLKLRPQH